MIFRIVAFLWIIFVAAAPAQAARDIIAGPVKGQVLRVIDGDTMAVRLHIWIGQHIDTNVRIGGIDTPEIKGKCARERDLAQSARAETELLVEGGQVTLYDIQLEKYAGRVLARAVTPEGVSIGDRLIEKGYARPYHGARRMGWCASS